MQRLAVLNKHLILSRGFASGSMSAPRLVVIGGVAGGASVAARARRLAEHADITVLEKGPDVSFANCGMPYYIGNTITDASKLHLHTPATLSTLLRLNVKAGTIATKIDRTNKLVHTADVKSGKTSSLPYDKLVLSMGAFPLVPPLPGLADNPKVVTLRNLEDMKAIKAKVQAKQVKNIVVLGAGFIGIEMAEQLAEIGKTVTIVDKENGVLPLMDVDMTQMLVQQLEMHGIKVVLSNGVKGVSTSADGQTTVDLDSGSKLPADLVLLSIGVRPDTTLAKEAGIKLAPSGHVEVNEFHQTSDQDVYAVGDCVITKDGVVDNQMIAAALAGPANRQARLVADHIYAPELAAGYPGSLGTAIIKVFDAAAGLTGWTEKRLNRAKIPYRSTVVSGFGHASYYPGAQQLTVKLTWCPETHRLLGGQVVGGMDSGVDKRLDVLATALRSKMTIEQLVHLELSYAPPFGNAKDVLNVAAFSAMNQIHGLINPLPAIPDDADIQVVDVRDRAVVEVKPLVHQSVNIPLAELRSRIHELDKSKPVITVCNVGKTSYFAARVLSQNGFTNVFSLQGGTSNHTDMCVHDPTPVVVEHKAPPSPTSAVAAESKGPVPPPIKLDCTGLSCPGPLLQIKKASDKLTAGQEMHVTASDPGFANDVKAFARTNGLDVLSVRTDRGLIHAEVRKGGAPTAVASAVGFTPMGATPSGPSEVNKNAAIIVFSRDMDKVLASLVLANGACAMGGKTTMFFTFWGLAFLRKPSSGGIMASMNSDKSLLDKAMGYMLGAGFNLPLSSMNFGGMGPMMMNYQMTSKQLPTLESLLKNAKENNIRMIACTMSMDAMGIKKEELIDGVELGGVADFMAASYDSGLKLFI